MNPDAVYESAEPATMVKSRRTFVRREEEWNGLLQRLGGQMHQSWQWGEFKRKQSWLVERVLVDSAAGTGMAQLLIKKRGPFSTVYVPRGPIVRGDSRRVLVELFDEIEAIGRKHHAIRLSVEPEMPLELDALTGRYEVITGGHRYSPGRTVIVPLVDDQALLAQMHASKRREVRRAERRGIVVEKRAPDDDSIRMFHALMQDMGSRNQIRISPPENFYDYLLEFGDDSALMFSIVDGKNAAALIAGKFGDRAVYLWGASSSEHRVPGAAAYLQYQAMRWARDRGCSEYDLWGIPEADPVSLIGPDGKPIRSIGEDVSGLYRFKVELGGETHRLPPPFEIRYRPRLVWMFQQLKAANHAWRH